MEGSSWPTAWQGSEVLGQQIARQQILPTALGAGSRSSPLEPSEENSTTAALAREAEWETQPPASMLLTHSCCKVISVVVSSLYISE